MKRYIDRNIISKYQPRNNKYRNELYIAGNSKCLWISLGNIDLSDHFIYVFGVLFLKSL